MGTEPPWHSSHVASPVSHATKSARTRPLVGTSRKARAARPGSRSTSLFVQRPFRYSRRSAPVTSTRPVADRSKRAASARAARWAASTDWAVSAGMEGRIYPAASAASSAILGASAQSR